ncbi:hypothetical protein J3R82DRAFT_482, partial [Butyriboletus roseoflavus]
MFIAIVGTRAAGKSTIEDYLVSKGFTSVRLARKDLSESHTATPATQPSAVHLSETLAWPRPPDNSERQSFLNMNSPVFSAFPHRSHPTAFASPEDLLSHVTRHWRKNFVTVDLTSSSLVNFFAKRPFFFLVNVDAPLLQRYRRLQGYVFLGDCLQAKLETISVQVLYHWRNFPYRKLHLHLDSLDITNTERLRPQWDTYFMAWNVLSACSSEADHPVPRPLLSWHLSSGVKMVVYNLSYKVTTTPTYESILSVRDLELCQDACADVTPSLARGRTIVGALDEYLVPMILVKPVKTLFHYVACLLDDVAAD